MPKSLFPSASTETRARLEQDPTLKLINDYDWSSNPLGPIPTWPESLRGAVRVMMAASTPMVMMIGATGILIYNNAYAGFAADRHPEIFGMPALEAWPEIAEFNRHKIKLGLRGHSLILRDQELVLNRYGQLESGWMDLHYSPLLNDDGVPLGTLCIVHETTDRVVAEKALARSEERMSLALSGASLIGTWDWDVTKNIVTADDKFAKLYNLDPLHAGLGAPLEDFMGAIHPDDVERVTVTIEASLADGSPFQSEYRLVAPDGSVRWVIASGRPRRGADGTTQRLPGVVVDVTDQRLTSDALVESELRFRTLADTMPQMVWSTLPDGVHDYYNARWYEFTGVPAGSTDSEIWKDLIHPDDVECAQPVWFHALATGAPYQMEYRLRHHSGLYRWTLGLALPIRDASGQIIRWIGTCTDIHETRLATEEREIVTQELSHRIKNIFAVLTGIISLSARGRPEVKDFADELRQRVYALGEAHDFVRPQNTDEPGQQRSLRALVSRLMQPYRENEQDRVDYTGEDAEIDDGAATPLALLFHELGTNAAKYGSLSLAGGRVHITGATVGDSYHLTWKEQGGPPISEVPQLNGFGSRLIRLSVEGQLNGQIETKWEPDGLQVVVQLPQEALRRTARLKT
ncbi:PAS domain-containing protein [Devosia sp. 2618]|uniref:PAS domain-containing sensor histidine kinase n=1 Tax=Devosia sp. 2618 TaxID=3156454 RepID=UPI0033996EEC